MLDNALLGIVFDTFELASEVLELVQGVFRMLRLLKTPTAVHRRTPNNLHMLHAVAYIDDGYV